MSHPPLINVSIMLQKLSEEKRIEAGISRRVVEAWPRSGCGTKEMEDAEGFSRRDGKAVKSESLARLNHHLAGGVIIAALATVGAGDTRDVVAPPSDEHDHTVGGDAKPHGRRAEPPACIDAGAALHAKLGLGVATDLGTKEFLGLRKQGFHVSDSFAPL